MSRLHDYPQRIYDSQTPAEQRSTSLLCSKQVRVKIVTIIPTVGKIIEAAEMSGANANTNNILASLFPEELSRMAPDLEQVTLQADQPLFHYGDSVKRTFFPITAVVSLRCLLAEGKSIEIGQVGHESLIGLPAMLGPDIALHTAEVLIPGQAVMIRTEALRGHYATNNRLHRQLAWRLWALLNQFSRLSVCNLCHRISERISRWLLALHDRARVDDLNLTHERIADLLGIRRASVTTHLGSLAKIGAIQSGRGRVRITDRDKLKKFSCECYKRLAEESKMPIFMNVATNGAAKWLREPNCPHLASFKGEESNFKDPVATP